MSLFDLPNPSGRLIKIRQAKVSIVQKPYFLFGLPLAPLHPKPVTWRTNVQGGGMKDEQVRELLYQALETEIGGVQVYTTAIRCAQNEELKEEWEEYLDQ